MIDLGVSMFWDSEDKDKDEKEEKKSYTGHCTACGKLSNFEWNGNHYQCTNWGCGEEVR